MYQPNIHNNFVPLFKLTSIDVSLLFSSYFNIFTEIDPNIFTTLTIGKI